MGHLQQLLAKNPTVLKSYLQPKTANLFDVAPKLNPRETAKNNVVAFRNADKKGLSIDYSETKTQFGVALAASTGDKLCFLGLNTHKLLALDDVQSRFPKATFTQKKDKEVHQLAFASLDGREISKPVSLALFGTEFQCAVWQRLNTILRGEILAYSNIAKEMGDEKLSRAIGTAVGANPIAYLIPCHRVIQNSGRLGGYMWGLEMKIALLSVELNVNMG